MFLKLKLLGKISLENIGWSTVIRTLIHYTERFQGIIHRKRTIHYGSIKVTRVQRKPSSQGDLGYGGTHVYNLMGTEEDIHEI